MYTGGWMCVCVRGRGGFGFAALPLPPSGAGDADGEAVPVPETEPATMTGEATAAGATAVGTTETGIEAGTEAAAAAALPRRGAGVGAAAEADMAAAAFLAAAAFFDGARTRFVLRVGGAGDPRGEYAFCCSRSAVVAGSSKCADDVEAVAPKSPLAGKNTFVSAPVTPNNLLTSSYWDKCSSGELRAEAAAITFKVGSIELRSSDISGEWEPAKGAEEAAAGSTVKSD